MIVSIIGTRPQYIKVKPIYDYCKENNIEHSIWDTNQHYDFYMSQNLITDLGIEIDYNLKIEGANELRFIEKLLCDLNNSELTIDSKFLLYGDTNTAFAAAIALHKLEMPFGHIEAGARCGNKNVPEEINRMYVDSVAKWNFCASPNDLYNVNDGILAYDLEYELLNKLNPKIEHQDFAMLTIHRQENMYPQHIIEIFKFIKQLKIAVTLPVHHRLRKQTWFGGLDKPDNLEIIDPLPYTEMVNALAQCSFIISDSGSVPKIAPFFGKKCLILRNEIGWKEVIGYGYGRLCTYDKQDIEWVKTPMKPDKYFYSMQGIPSSKIIINNLL